MKKDGLLLHMTSEMTLSDMILKQEARHLFHLYGLKLLYLK